LGNFGVLKREVIMLRFISRFLVISPLREEKLKNRIRVFLERGAYV
jgi:hypothetical protein